MNKVQEVAKFLVAIITVAVAFGATFIPVSYNEYLSFAAAILGVVAVYVFPNTKTLPPVVTPAPVIFQSPIKDVPAAVFTAPVIAPAPVVDSALVVAATLAAPAPVVVERPTAIS